MIGCSSLELKKYFEGINESLVSSEGSSKAINKSMNDNFQRWTRQHLSKFLVINDFDGFYMKDSTVFILELKRVRESCEKWHPYTDDISNYRACLSIVADSGFHRDNFKTIAYNDYDSSKVFVVIINELLKNSIRGVKGITHPTNVFTHNEFTNFESNKSRFRRS